jgi:hypothetical protein
MSFLTELRKRAGPRGPILLSFFTRTEWSPYDDLTYRLARASRFFVGREKELVERGDHLTSQFIHFFKREELGAELQEAGFTLAYFSEEPYGHAIGISD